MSAAKTVTATFSCKFNDANPTDPETYRGIDASGNICDLSAAAGCPRAQRCQSVGGVGTWVEQTSI